MITTIIVGLICLALGYAIGWVRRGAHERAIHQKWVNDIRFPDAK